MNNCGVHCKSYITLLFYQITVKVCVFMVDVLKTRQAILPVFVTMAIKVWIAVIQLVSSNQITLNSLPTGKLCMLFCVACEAWLTHRDHVSFGVVGVVTLLVSD